MRRIVIVGLGACLVIAAVASAAGASRDASSVKRLVITKADAGRGFVVETSRSSPSDAGFVLIAQCVGRPVPVRKVTARADGPTLANASLAAQISSTAEMLETKAMVVHDRSVVADPKFAPCRRQSALQALSGQAISSVTVIPLIASKKIGDFTTVLGIQINGQSNGQPFTLTVEQFFAQKGRAEINCTFAAQNGRPFGQALARTIENRLAKRLEKVRAS